MKRLEYLQLALKAGLYKHFDWVVSAFAIAIEDPQAYAKGDSFAYRIVQTPTGHFYVGGHDPNALILIEDAPANQPIFRFNDKITVGQDVCLNIKDDKIETTIGQLLFNLICIVEPFGNKLPYITGKVTVSNLENKIAGILVDDPKGEDVGHNRPDVIYVSEYLKMIDSFSYLERFSQLCAWAATEKTMLPPTGIDQFKRIVNKI